VYAVSSGALNRDDYADYLNRAANERVAIVDENNEVIGEEKRSVVRQNRLPHRSTFAFIKNSKNLFYVQKRSNLKDYCPGYYDPTPGGVVGAGESYEETNRREVEEEMGIPASVPMNHLFTFYYEDERVRSFGDAWEGVFDGEMKLQVEEVESIHLMSMSEILERAANGEKFTPDSIFACNEYIKRYGIPEPV
jgi:isopentenyldiphosphate isomerase